MYLSGGRRLKTEAETLWHRTGKASHVKKSRFCSSHLLGSATRPAREICEVPMYPWNTFPYVFCQFSRASYLQRNHHCSREAMPPVPKSMKENACDHHGFQGHACPGRLCPSEQNELRGSCLLCALTSA